MTLSRRLFAIGAAGLVLTATAAYAAPGDELAGTWEGRLTLVTGPGLLAPDYVLEPLRFVITPQGAVQVFLADEHGVYSEAKANSFRMGRLGANAVIVSLEAYSPLGQGWVETWSFAVSLRGANTLSVVFTRQVNNMQLEPSDPEAIFQVVHTGELQRVFSDHV